MRLEPLTVTEATTVADLVAFTLDAPRRGATGQVLSCCRDVAERIVSMMPAWAAAMTDIYPGQPFVTVRGLPISLDIAAPPGVIVREVDDPADE